MTFDLYPQDKVMDNPKTNSETTIGISDRMDDKQKTIEEGIHEESRTFGSKDYHDQPSEPEDYSPYPSNFMIPKGVCEKSEPVIIINNK